MADRQSHPRLFRIGSRSSLRSSQDGGPSGNDDAVSISSKASTDSLGNRISSKLKNFFSTSNLKSHIRKHSLSVRHSSLSTEDIPSTSALSPEPSVSMSDPAYPSPSPSPDPPPPPPVPVFLPEVETTRFSWLPERGVSPTINGTAVDRLASNTPHSLYSTSTTATTSSVSPSRTDTPYLAEPQPSTSPQVHSSLLNRKGSLRVPSSDTTTAPPARVPSPRPSTSPSLRPKSISLDPDGLSALLQQLPPQATPNEQLINLVASSLDPTFIASRRAALSKFEMFETAPSEPTDAELELVKLATAGGAEIDNSSPSSSPPNLTNDPSSTSMSSTTSSIEESAQQQQFWVPAHAHPELHPTEFKQWIASHMEHGDGGSEGSGTTAAPKIDDGLGAMLTLSRKPLRRTKSFIERHVSITPDNIDLFADLESPVEEKGVGKEEKEAEETEQVASVPETSIAESRNSFDFGPTDDDWATHSAVDHERKVKGLPPLKRGKIVKGKRVVPTMNRTPSTSPESTTDEGRKSIDTGEILEVQLPDAPADSNESPTHHKKKKKKRRTANTEVSELGLATLQTGEEEAMQRYEEMQRRAEALTNALAMAMPGPDPVKPISTPPPPTQTLEKVSSSADSVASDRSSIDTIRTYESTESSWSSKRPKKTSWSWLMNLIRPSNSSSSSSTSSLSPSPPEITYYYPPEPTDETAGGYGPRYPLHLEKHIYAVSHTKLADQRRTLAEQVSISNLMLYIISVHADVTLKRRGPRRKKGKKKKKRRGMRELVSLESSGEPQHDGDGAAERMKDKHFREVFVGARTSSLGQVQVQVQVQHVQQPPAAQPQQQQQQHHQYGGGSFSFEPTEQYRPVSNNTNKATTSVPSVPVVAAGTPATSSSAPVTYTYTRWTSGFHSTGGNEDDFSGSDGDSDSSQESDDEEGEKKWSGYYWGGNSSVAVSDGGGGAYSPYLASPIQVSTVNEEEEDDLVPLGELKKRRQSPQR